MTHTYEELKKLTIAELREIAKVTPHDALQGYTQLNKDHLLPALCAALGIEAHEHHSAALAEKSSIKATMRRLKEERERAMSTGDYAHLAQFRHQYHHLNHVLRTSAKRAARH